jgi:hypothetical protein
MADNKRIVYTIEVNDKGKVKIEDLTKGFVNANIAVNKLNADLLTQGNIMEDNAKKNQQMIDKTGLAGATLVELGRTISDSNYGIRGMANNISQLATLMTTLLFTTGGFMKGLKALAGAFFGPLGVIVGFQAIIALIEGQAIASQKAQREASALGDALGKAGSDLQTFVRILDESNISQEELSKTVEQLNDNYKDLNLEIDDEGKLTEASRLIIEKKIISLKRLAKAQAIQLELEKLYQEEIQADILLEEKLAEVGERKWYEKALDNVLFYSMQLLKIRGKEEVTFDEFNEKLKKSRTEDIIENYNTEVKKREDRIAELIKTLTDENLINESFGNKEEEDELARLDRLKKLREKYVEDAKIDDRLHKDEQLEQEKQLVLDQAEIDGAGKELLLAIEEDFNQRIDAAKQARREKEARERERDLMKSIRYANQIIRIEQNRLKAEQEIQSQRVGFAQQVAGILATIAKDGSTLAKVAFALEKGAAIADIVVKAQQSVATQIAANQAANMQATAAYASIPFIGPLKATAIIAANNAMLAKGITATKVGAGLSIASILATSLTSKGGGVKAPASAASQSPSAPAIQAPAFNVVGATQTSQLAQTISQSEQQPIKAFVVASDVSTAQELERSTIEGASIG